MTRRAAAIIALLTDRYELTMLAAAVAEGLADRRAVFEVFCRRLPPGRRYAVLAGPGRLAELLPQVCFGATELAALRAVTWSPAGWAPRHRTGTMKPAVKARTERVRRRPGTYR